MNNNNMYRLKLSHAEKLANCENCWLKNEHSRDLSRGAGGWRRFRGHFAGQTRGIIRRCVCIYTYTCIYIYICIHIYMWPAAQIINTKGPPAYLDPRVYAGMYAVYIYICEIALGLRQGLRQRNYFEVPVSYFSY